ncbi:hypothetical protein F8568_017765 [Actinomadura sp. LD22]|uniref:Uncharacterized protein n=1 Tax=Actinomadura physcomitrii TaxID=2650748 RepID=A0A6I4M7M7_9ACTN|nr:hypothetical protein [Actinomadura physcomitrii]MWA02188.1 hypothetical protein [Actinomadura physcomitrii]
MTMNKASMGRLLGGLTVTGTLLLTAACGGGGGDGKANAGSTKAAGTDQMSAFRACLEKQGVTLPNRGNRPSGAPSGRPSGAPSGGFGGARPSGRPSGAPSGRASGRPTDRPTRSAAQQKAMQACASLAPQGGRGGQFGPPGNAPNGTQNPSPPAS